MAAVNRNRSFREIRGGFEFPEQVHAFSRWGQQTQDLHNCSRVCVLGLALRVVMKFTGRGLGPLGAKRVRWGRMMVLAYVAAVSR